MKWDLLRKWLCCSEIVASFELHCAIFPIITGPEKGSQSLLTSTSAIMYSFYIVPILVVAIYLFRRLTSPLRSLPGPTISILTSLWLKYQEFTSNRREYIHALHKQYGSVVRLGPSEVSFASLEAMKEIYLSGGSGYDKSELYSLFQQYNTRCVSRGRK